MHVRRDAAWVEASVQRLQPLLALVLPPLCTHSSSAVRVALSKGRHRLIALWLGPTSVHHCMIRNHS